MAAAFEGGPEWNNFSDYPPLYWRKILFRERGQRSFFQARGPPADTRLFLRVDEGSTDDGASIASGNGTSHPSIKGIEVERGPKLGEKLRCATLKGD